MSVEMIAVADSKRSAQRFIADNWGCKVGHSFTDLEDLAGASSHCTLHDSVCKVVPFTIVDCFVTGNPCQAWTRQRTRDAANLAPALHPGWEVTFVKFFKVLDSSGVKMSGGIAEQVLGFADPDHRS